MKFIGRFDGFAAGLALLGLVLLAGCGGGLGGVAGGGGDPLTFAADPIDVSNGTASEAGFDVVVDEPVTVERAFEVQGQSQEVVLEIHQLQLERSGREAPLSTVVFLSVPQVELLGQQLDLLQQVSPVSLLSRAQGESAALEAEQKIGERSVAMLGGQRTVEVYRGTAGEENRSARVKIYQTTFAHDGDTIVGIGVAPKDGDDGQSMLTVFEAIRR